MVAWSLLALLLGNLGRLPQPSRFVKWVLSRLSRGDLDMDRALMTYQVAHGTRRALLFNKADWTRQYRDAYEGAAAVEGLDVLDAEVHRRVAYRQAIGTRPTDLGEFAQVAAQIQEMLK
ncbi:hypothetical protein FB33_1665 [Cutibacterium acnes]|nr:hypothetical protein FB33_1665 [Cutibacterium acnes]